MAFTVPQIGGGGAQGVTGAVDLGNAGSGDITFAGSGANAFDIGGKLTVTSDGGANAYQFSGTDTVITADGGIEFVSTGSTADTITLTDEKDLTLTANAADITVTGVVGVDGNTGEDFTISITQTGATGGTATVGAIGTDINDVVITAPTIKLGGNITTALDENGAGTADDDAASIDLNGDVVINASTVTLTTGNGTIDFSDNVNSAANADNNLTIVSGTGTATFNDAIGTGTNGEIGTLTVNSAGAGDITFATNADIGTTSAAGAAVVNVGNTDTGTLTIKGSVYNTSGAQTYTASTGENIDLTGG